MLGRSPGNRIYTALRKKTMDVIERRKHRRYSVYCPIEYKREDDSPIDICVTLNLSEGGALIATREPISPGTEIIVKITLKGEIFFVRAKVVRVENHNDASVYNVGVRFEQNSFNFVRRFYEEVETILLYQRECIRETGRQVSLPEASMKWYNTPQ